MNTDSFFQVLFGQPRTTGSAIATAIRNRLQKHTIEINNCRGQVYDTTVSMSADKKNVQAQLAKYAPRQSIKVAAFIRSTLLYAMLAKYIQFRTLMDSCHQLFSFSVNSPKHQKFLATVIDVLFPETKKRKLKDLRFVRDEVDQESLHI